MIDDKLHWEFAATGGGDVTGENDPLSSFFKGNKSYYLAREALQNVIDAKLPGSKDPARAEFRVYSRKPSELPRIDELKNEAFIHIRDRYKDDNDEYKAYSDLIFTIEHDFYIQLLEISDYNTVGLSGANDDRKGNYRLLMKEIGASYKSGGAGGSWGLGKGAYWAASAFRTIFVSSVYGDNQCVFQGKARVASFIYDKIERQGNGCFGLTGQDPVRNSSQIPNLFKREDRGTDIHIVGFDERDWKDEMVKAVLNYFWRAISKGILEVNIGNEIITRKNLEKAMLTYFDDRIFNSENPWPYYRAYTEVKHVHYHKELPSLGEVDLYILPGDGYPRKVEYIRQNGMIIQKKVYTGIPGEYAAVFECENPEGNSILREMENPSHDKWDKENARGKEIFDSAVQAERELNKFVSESLHDFSSSQASKTLPIGGLAEIINLPGSEESSTISPGKVVNKDEDISHRESAVEIGATDTDKITVVPPPIIIRKVIPEQTTGTLGGDEPGRHHGSGHGGTTGIGLEGEGDEKIVVLREIKYRSFAVREHNDKVSHIVILRGHPGTTCNLDVRAGTDDSYDSVTVEKAEDIQGRPVRCAEHRIEGLKIGIDGELKLKIQLDSNQKYSLNITAYENK